MTVGKVKDFNFSSAGKTVGMSMGGKAGCYAKGGKVAPQGMLPNRGALGVIANKNPGELRNNTAPNLPGNVMMKHGGSAKGTHRMPDGKMMKDSDHKGMKKGGAVIPKAGYKKIDKVMTEFSKGKLHSGSKTGPEVTKPKQAVAIALSEARRADKKA